MLSILQFLGPFLAGWLPNKNPKKRRAAKIKQTSDGSQTWGAPQVFEQNKWILSLLTFANK